MCPPKRRKQHRARICFYTDHTGRGHQRVLEFTSQRLIAAEENYSATEKECLAIIWVIRKLRCYLEGYRFEVMTDHLALKWLNSIDNPTGRMARWALKLQQYHFDIKYRSRGCLSSFRTSKKISQSTYKKTSSYTGISNHGMKMRNMRHGNCVCPKNTDSECCQNAMTSARRNIWEQEKQTLGLLSNITGREFFAM